MPKLPAKPTLKTKLQRELAPLLVPIIAEAVHMALVEAGMRWRPKTLETGEVIVGEAQHEDWMNEMGADEGLPKLPPMGHPLQKLGARLAELLDDDHWAECERLLLEGWAHDEIDRKTGQHWRENSDLHVWYPITAEELERLRAENAELRHNAIGQRGAACGASAAPTGCASNDSEKEE